MAKKQCDYFEMLERQIAFSMQASNLLLDVVKDYSADGVMQWYKQMHEIEHAGDKARHEILSKLFHEFITPIDQTDILQLVQIVDDVTDAIDEVVIDLYMYNITQLSKAACQLAQLVNNCVTVPQSAVGELRHYKKPECVREILIKVNTLESDADTVYIGAIRELFLRGESNHELIWLKAVYDSLEHCCDLCEHAADMIEQTIMKNI